jgi:hypothetical protein
VGPSRVDAPSSRDDDGLLVFSTAGDPFRAQVAEAHILLEQLAVPVDAGARKAAEAIKASGRKVVRNALRAAVKERKAFAYVRPIGTPRPYGAARAVPDADHRAAQTRRTLGAPDENRDFERENRAAQTRRTDGAPETDAPQAGAPPLALYKERRTGALAENTFCSVCGLSIHPRLALDGETTHVTCQEEASWFDQSAYRARYSSVRPLCRTPVLCDFRISPGQGHFVGRAGLEPATQGL